MVRINFKVQDQLRRANNQPSTRVVPTIEQYCDHMVFTGLIPHNTSGGLYRGVFLKDFLHDGNTPTEFLQFLTSHKPWHGDPLAAFRRGIAVLRRLYFDEPQAKRKQYSSDDEFHPNDKKNPPPLN